MHFLGLRHPGCQYSNRGDELRCLQFGRLVIQRCWSCPGNELRRQGQSEDDDLVRQQRMAVGQIEHGLMRQLLGVIGAGSALEDNRVI